MRTTLLALATFGLLIIGCEGTDPTTPDSLGLTPQATAAGAVVHRVHMGGADICEGLGLPPGCDANHSLIAMEFADGRVTGQWHDEWAGGIAIHVPVACLSVSGNEAWVSGTCSSLFCVPGTNFVIRLQDNGTNGDQASLVTVTDNPDDCTLQPDLDLFELSNGVLEIQ